ncbi:MAG: C45 family peptidase [Actinomycetota bacterium]
MRRPPIRVLDVAGSPSRMGATHGAAFADEIRHYAEERIDLVCEGRWSGGPLARAEVIAIAESMIPAHEAFDADLHAEMEAMASEAQLSIAEAIIVGGFTDFVDTVAAATGGRAPTSVLEDDCTAVIVPDSRAQGSGFLAQTWDMHDTATDHVLLLRIAPDDAPAARVFTTTGCLGQIGMNSEGVCVGINNLNALDGRPGVAWTSVVRGMLKTSTAAEALDVLLGADLAGAHNFVIFDADGAGYDVEAMPSVRPVVPLADHPICHTNHVLDADASAVQAPRDPWMQQNSAMRLDHARELLAAGPIDQHRIFELTRDERAICQQARPPFHIESSGAAVMRPKTDDFWACWGRPAQNEYVSITATGDTSPSAPAFVETTG